MTATAFAYELAFEDAFGTDAFGAEAGYRPETPNLALLPGGGGDSHDVALLAAALDPMVEVYRRRRFMAALALTAILLLVAQLAGLSVTSFGPLADSVDPATPIVHVVMPGDTYGGIAASMGAEHPQSFALALQAANADAELVIGQRLVVDPVSLRASS